MLVLGNKKTKSRRSRTLKYEVELTDEELNDIWRAELMLDDAEDWTPAAIRAVSKRLGQLVERIKAADSDSEKGA